MYLLRAIHANGNEYKTIEEIFNSLDPKIDRQEFNRLLLRLRELVYLDEHNLSHKIRVNNIGETNLILIDRQEEDERQLRESLRPAKKPLSHTIKRIIWTYIYPAGKWTVKKTAHIIIEVSIIIIAGYFIIKYNLPH